ncbi:MAG: homoserine dehydrogenase [Atribacterota bacterium]|nr:homoserine dehydrogenase [Atribacterota bacterium]MDD4895352.1 homoserine dehydrogenase [Atribacterota bacterium]MDD5637102.1 homoserine dehydrogenase [Atribacterota bacterium]
MWNKEIGIGILGLGNVGGGTLAILEMNKAFIEQEIFPYKIKIVGLADLDANREPKSKVDYLFFTTVAQGVIKHPDIQIVIEAIGGEYPAYNLIKQALEKGKHVVTPNKEVVAKHGYELLEIAHKNNVQFLFEASVGSAIPILEVILNILTSCPLSEISGILNGTTNYILDLMWEQNITQKEALKKAQNMGYAEADPSKDINGLDAMYKMFILATLGFRGRLNLNQINYSGIGHIALDDIQLAKQLGYRIKLLATARKKYNELDFRISPVLIKEDHLLSNIQGANNGIFLSGNGYGDLFFSGAGAGGIAGASMIISDIIRIIRKPQNFEYNFLLKDFEELKIEKLDQVEHSYFLKIKIGNKQEDRENIRNVLLKNSLLVDGVSEIKHKDNTLTIGFIIDSIEERKAKEAIREIKKVNYIQAIDYLEVYQKAIQK